MRVRLRRLPGPARLRRFARELRGPARRSALRAVADGVWVAVTLRRRGVRPLAVTRSADGRVDDWGRARRVADAVDAGLGLIPMSPTCLRRSLTLARELDRLGLSGDIHLGVRDVDGRIEAHAWVQVGADILNDEPALIATYTPLDAGALERLAAVVK
jgi:hypothetical protein